MKRSSGTLELDTHQCVPITAGLTLPSACDAATGTPKQPILLPLPAAACYTLNWEWDQPAKDALLTSIILNKMWSQCWPTDITTGNIEASSSRDDLQTQGEMVVRQLLLRDQLLSPYLFFFSSYRITVAAGSPLGVARLAD